MSDFSVTDPCTQVYNKLWSVLEANSEFTDLVKPGNRIKLIGTDEDPIKQEVQKGDLPEVAIFPIGGPNQIIMTSDNAKIERTFSLTITSGSLRANRYLFPIEWVIFKIFHNANNTLGLDFVVKCVLSPSEQMMDNEELNRGTKGWSSIINIDVEMVIPRNALSA